MINTTDLLVIGAGYVIGLVIGTVYGIRSGKQKFWRMPGNSWKVRK
ncbi:MAG: hypothetical protein GOU98_04670 [Candidatus Altiarchaeota archaeon]|nr:hypothetical protein [Candidatus Altiarchaeota archaeon]